ncbi:MAG TPA: VWA domain-containing protein [Polyangium sp.]|nr:VWA domain-containing protein [Polyangium sp.]
MTTYDAETRWRLILGKAGDEGLGSSGSANEAAGEMDDALSWLYDREAEGDARRSVARGAGPGRGPGHAMDVPDWINAIHNLFPQEAIERLESDALQRYGILEVVTRPEALANVTPSLSLAEAILRCKSRMDARVLDAARALVDRVVEELKKKLCDEMEHRLGATPFRHRRSRFRIAKNLDALRTIRKNLQHYDRENRRLIIEKPEFFARVRRFGPRHQVIIVVDQSGSMARNIIHAAVVASVLWKLPATTTHLVVYDTEVVDLTQFVDDPVELLFRVQLGGGTDGAKALQYASQLIEIPHRTILLWITDFEDDPGALARETRALVGEGVIMFGAASLDDQVQGAFDHGVAQAVAEAGAHVAATTPSKLVGWIVEKMRQ